MRLVVSDKILKLTSLLVVILWLSPTLIEFTVNLGVKPIVGLPLSCCSCYQLLVLST